MACINSVGATPTNASTVQWSITFREPVIGVDVSDFVVDATGTAAASNAVLSGSGLDYTLTVTTAGNGNLTPRLVDDDSITDSAGNPLSGTGIGNGTFTGQSITVDHVPPVVTSILEGNSSLNAVDFVVRFSEAVTGVDLTDFSAAFFGTAGGSLTGITGSGGYYTVTIGSLVGDGAVKLNLVDDDSIADLVGNKLGGTGSENGSFTGGSAVVDHTPPVVASITRLNSTPTKATNVQWRVLFSEYVTGVTFNDFSFATAGHLGWLTGTGYDYTLDLDVTYTAGLTVAPQLVDDDSIVDFVGNKLGGTGTGNGNFTGPSYTVDHTPPGLASTSVNGGAAQRSMVTQVEAVFSEAVNLSAGALTVLWRDGSALLGTFTVSIVNTSGDQRTWDITFSGRGAIGNSLSDGFYKLVVSGAYVKDLAGNAMMGNSTVYFHRLFGDLDGDRDVDAKDLAVIRQKLNKPASYVPWLDYDGDGRIDNADYLQFRLRLIKPLLK